MEKKILAVGTPVLATQNVGPVLEGQPGFITGFFEQKIFFFWRRTVYLCTFFGNVKIAMNESEISDFDHGHSMEEIEFDQHESLSISEQLQRIRPLER